MLTLKLSGAPGTRLIIWRPFSCRNVHPDLPKAELAFNVLLVARRIRNQDISTFRRCLSSFGKQRQFVFDVLDSSS